VSDANVEEPALNLEFYAKTCRSFSRTTQRAEPIFHPAALSLAYVEQLHHACDALLDKKWASAARSY